ncbi:hypothetical protein HDU88_005760 [Geranomyces variabilis]|nr:hypothetical protein HDU88_005760 [Geranomyces variabilis]
MDDRSNRRRSARLEVLAAFPKKSFTVAAPLTAGLKFTQIPVAEPAEGSGDELSEVNVSSSEDGEDSDEDDDDEQEPPEEGVVIEKVLGQKTKSGEKLCFVKWRGYDDDANEWVLENTVDAALIAKYVAMKKRGRVGAVREEEYDDQAPAKGRRHVTKRRAIGQGDEVEDAEPTAVSSEDDDGEKENQTVDAPRVKKKSKTAANGKPVRIRKAGLLAAKKSAIETRKAERALAPFPLAEPPASDNEPDVSCCGGCSTREYIRAVETGNVELLKACLACKDKIPRWTHSTSPNLPYFNAAYAAYASNNLVAAKLLHEDSGPRVSAPRGTGRASTGYVSRSTFGHALAKLNESRGNREGNAAFESEPLHDPLLGQATHDDIDVRMLLGFTAMTPETFDYHLLQDQDCAQHAVYHAAASGSLEMTAHLVTELTRMDGWGFNELHNSVLKGPDGGGLGTYRKNQILKKAIGNYRITPLQLAAINPHTSHMEELYRNLSASENSEPDDQGRTAVHFAAGARTPAALAYLLEEGADASKDAKGRVTPLLLAAMYGREQNIQLIMSAGCHADHTLMKNKARAIHFASQYGQLEAVKVLAEAGAELDAKATKEKLAPLHLAAARGHIEVVRFLLSAGAAIDCEDRMSRQALIHAIKNGHAAIAQLLLEHGADPNAADSSDNTALHYAAGFGGHRIVTLLLFAGANLNAANNWKFAPIMIADMKGHLKIVTQLLSCKDVLVNSRDNTGCTMLHRCLTQCDSRNEADRLIFKIKALLANQADPRLADLEGNTPLHIWAELELTEPPHWSKEAGFGRDDLYAVWGKICDLFVEAGADINAKNKEGKTPFEMAIENDKGAPQIKHLLQCKADIKESLLFYLVKKMVKLDKMLMEPTDSPDLGQAKKLEEHAKGLADLESLGNLLRKHYAAHVRSLANATDSNGIPPIIAAIKESILHQDEVRALFSPGNSWGGFNFLSRFYGTEPSTPFDIQIDYHWKAVMAVIKLFVSFGASPSCQVQFPPDWKVGTGTPAPVELGYTALHFAAKIQDPVLLQFLVDMGSKTTPPPLLSFVPLPLYLVGKARAEYAPTIEMRNQKRGVFKFESATKRWVDTMTILLAAGANPCAICTQDGDTALLRFARDIRPRVLSEIEAATNLIAPGTIRPDLLALYISACPANGVDQTREDAKTALMFFIEARNLPATKSLVTKANVDRADGKGATSVMYAIATRDNAYLEAILTVPCDLTLRDANGKTALILALSLPSETMANMLLKAGKDCAIDIMDDQMVTALHSACANGFSETVRHLVSLGARTEVVDKKHETALIHALRSKSRDCIAALLEAKSCNVNVQSSDGRWALHLAVENNDWKVVKMLLEAGARTDVRDKFAITPLHVAIQRSKSAVNTSLKIERLLVAAGAPINAADVQGRTPLHIAFVDMKLIPAMHISTVQRAARSKVQALAAQAKRASELRAADLTLKWLQLKDVEATEWLNAPFKTAAKNRAEEAVIETKDNVDEPHPGLEWTTEIWEGNPKMMKADPIEIISWLLELPGIEIDVPDKFGRTPLHYAAARGSFTATSYLVTRGATVERIDADKNTTLQIGLLYHNVDYCTMLAKLGSRCGGIMCLPDGTTVTAFQYSLKHGFMSLAYMIMEKGQQFLDAFRDCLVTGKYHLAILLLSRASPKDLRSVHKTTKQNVMHMLVDFSPTDPITWYEYAVEMFDMIKPLGLDFALGDYRQRTPLYLACMRRQQVLVPLLLPQSKGSITTPCTEGRSALSWALTWKNLEILTMLVRDNMTLPAENGVRGMTYIHLAVQLGSRQILQRLIELNATIDEFSAPATGHIGVSTPLVLAIASNNAEFVRMLLAAGADPNKASYAEGTVKPPIKLAPPIFAALNCAGTEQGVLEILLLAGASANAIHPTTRLSPLQVAAGRTGVVEVLLRYNANVNYIHPVTKRTPFQVALYAVNQGRVDASLKRLFACSPDVNLLDELSGHTVLDHAIIQDNLELLETALKHGARIDNLSRDREPSLVRCARLNRLGCLKRLLKEGLDSDTLNASDVHGRTLLHACVAPRLVASFENVEMLQLIMREPCLDTEVKDNEGLRAVELAFAQHSKVMYNAMLQFGAKDVVVTPPAAIPVAMEIDVPTVDVDADAERARQEILALKAEKLKAERTKRAAALGLSLEAFEKQEKRHSCSLDAFLQLSSTTATVLFEDSTDTPYDVLMNKCDVDKGYYGSNLFYKMQIAHNLVADNYILLTRFGGVGEDGMHQRTPFPSKEACVAEFEKIFKAKTGNAWGAEFHSKPGRYTPVRPSTKVDVPLPEVSFDTGAIPGTRTGAVERFVKIIADIPELSANVSEQDLGLSLGSIDHDTVQRAQEVLIEISAAVTELERIQREEVLPNVKMLKDLRNNIVKLSSKFFTLLPTANEPRGGIKPLFNKRDIDAQKLKLANILYVDSASTLLLGAHARRHEMHPVDYILTGLKCDLTEVADRASDSFQLVQEYLYDTRGEGSQYEISNLFEADRNGERGRMSKGGFGAQTRMMLWHGTRSSNFLGILSSGLRIAPVGARLSGQMYGAGIYFGDQFQKSVGYAHNHAPGLNGYVCLLLCAVAVGEQPYESEQAEPELVKAPGSAIATKGLGKRGPTGAMVRCEDGVIVPCAPIVQYPLRKNDKGEGIERCLNFNEYIVYDPSQVRIRYVVLARDTSLCFLCRASGWGLQTMEYYRDSRFATSTTDHKIPSTSFGGNSFEQAICQSIMHKRKESVKELWQDHVDRVIENNKLFKARWSCPTKMEKYDKVCTTCADTLLSDMLMQYAVKHRNEAPMAISKRPDCWWGRTCRNQAKMEHAQRTSHTCDAIRKPGDANVFCLNAKNVILEGATLSGGFLRLESGRATAKTTLDLQKPVTIEFGTTISAETRINVALHTQSVSNAHEAPLSVMFNGHNRTISICSADSGELANVTFPEKALVTDKKRQFVTIRLTADTLWVQFAAGVARDGHSGTDFVKAVSVKASAVQLCGALNVSVSLLGTQEAVAYDWSMWEVRNDEQISS